MVIFNDLAIFFNALRRPFRVTAIRSSPGTATTPGVGMGETASLWDSAPHPLPLYTYLSQSLLDHVTQAEPIRFSSLGN